MACAVRNQSSKLKSIIGFDLAKHARQEKTR